MGCERRVVDGNHRAGGYEVGNRGGAAVDRDGTTRDQPADLANGHDDQVRLGVVDQPHHGSAHYTRRSRWYAPSVTWDEIRAELEAELREPVSIDALTGSWSIA